MRTQELTRQQRPSHRARWEHDEFTAPFTFAKRTNLRLPMADPMDTGPYALFVLDQDVTTEMINNALEDILGDIGSGELWLAEETFDKLGDDGEADTAAPVSPEWRSAFVGKNVEDAFRFMPNIPSEKNVQPNIIVVLDKHSYEKQDWVLLYRIDGDGEITCIPCDASMCPNYIVTTHDHKWKLGLKYWREEEKVAG